MSDEVVQGNDGVGRGDEGFDHVGAVFGADQQFAKALVVSGVGAFDDSAGVGLWGVLLVEVRLLQPRMASRLRVLL